MSAKHKADERAMQDAIGLARKVEGLTRPNPPVGAVVVNRGRVVGRGSHKRAGAPHAEIAALKEAGARAKGADLYVTLEPCSTWGRTPPCCDAIVEAGIGRVIVGTRDPNPSHRGKGLRLLRKKGIDVIAGVCPKEAGELIAPFAKQITTGMPYLTLKLGVSFDGKIADRKGHSRWITGPKARAVVQGMRRRADAIMVGAQTVARDDPQLWPRPSKSRRPFRVIVDRNGQTPLSARVINDEHAGRTIIATTPECRPNRVKQYVRRGVGVEILPSRSGNMSMSKLMERLAKLDVLHVLCEGGGELAEALIKEDVVDEIVIFIAPRIIGGREAVPSVSGRGWLMGSTPELEILSTTMVGNDVMIRARPMGKGSSG